MNKIKKNIPNVITGSRIAVSILGAILFMANAIPASIICYVYGAVSDFLDGHFAKKFNAFSELGRKLDAISDKIFALSLALPAIISGNILMLIPLYYETKIGLFNLTQEKQGKKVHTARIGKLKTASLFPTMILGLLSTVSLPLYIPFLPSLYLSTKLQLKTYKEYKRLSKIYIEDEDINHNMGIEHEDVNTIDKLKVLRKELEFYMNYQEPTKNNTKVKTRKKSDDNDRYKYN